VQEIADEVMRCLDDVLLGELSEGFGLRDRSTICLHSDQKGMSRRLKRDVLSRVFI